MIRDLGMSLIILVVSSGIGIAANSLRKNPIPWIRKELPPQEAVIDLATSSLKGTSAPAEKPGIVVIDTVLQYLASGEAFFIDAREEHDYKEGHLRGAVNLPSSAIFQNSDAVMSVVPSTAKVVVYCGGGTCEASHNVSDSLRREFGFTDVSVYEKGWEEIESSGRFGPFITKEPGH